MTLLVTTDLHVCVCLSLSLCLCLCVSLCVVQQKTNSKALISSEASFPTKVLCIQCIHHEGGQVAAWDHLWGGGWWEREGERQSFRMGPPA